MPAAAHPINILLVQIPATPRGEREEASQLQIYVSISENIWAEPISMKYGQHHSLGPTTTPPSSPVAAGDTGHQTPPLYSGSCLSSQPHPRTPTLPNIFQHHQIFFGTSKYFFLTYICDERIANSCEPLLGILVTRRIIVRVIGSGQTLLLPWTMI